MTENLMTAFELLGVGWGGIFVVMIVIYLVSLALSKIFSPGKDE
ncbi:OadG-related small transporter subunit [Enorma phocaeensis]|nr:OadG-related small transporter subunit [Enorma phocaeensis]